MEIAEGMKSIAEGIVSSHGERVKALDNLVSDSRKTLKGFSRDRNRMSREQAKNLADFVGGMSTSVEKLLKEFRKNHKKMSDEQAGNLEAFAKHMAAEVAALLGRFEKERGEMSAELRGSLEHEIKEIKTYVKKKLHEFDKAHAEMSSELKMSLAGYVNDMVKDVGTLLHGYGSDMKRARGIWHSMSRTIARAGGAGFGAASPSGIEKAEELKAKEPGDMDAEKLEKKVLKFILRHPEGVRVGDMEEPLGVARMRLGVIAKGLLEEGRVKKEENQYFPL